jgi:integrase/recombinase XerD
MNPLCKAVDDYLELRRALGFKLRDYDVCLRELVSFLESKGSCCITTKLAVEFATQRERQKPVSWARQLGIVRGFALYQAGSDPTTEVPPQGLLPFKSQRARPYIYTEGEIRRLLEAALNLDTPHKLQPWTYYCLFGLLAVSGMRLGETLDLKSNDVDWSESMLTIRNAKFGKSRLVPLHSSTRAVLLDYAERRDQTYAPRQVSYFFVSSHGTRLIATNVSKIFRQLCRQIGLRDPDAGNGPRIHDFRHRFAVETLLRWYRNGEEVSRRLPILSTYLGHANVTHTYWYLSNTPELMSTAAERLEARWKGALP